MNQTKIFPVRDTFSRLKRAEQLHLDIPSVKSFNVRKVIEVRKTLSLEKGMLLLNTRAGAPVKIRDELRFFGVKVAYLHPTKMKMLEAGKTQCVICGLKGTHFNLEKHVNQFADKKPRNQIFNCALYGWRNGEEIQLTWDHIVPKSLGGTNNILNAQCMCRECNVNKSNIMTWAELKFACDPATVSITSNYPIPVKTDTLEQTIQKCLNTFAGVSAQIRNIRNQKEKVAQKKQITQKKQTRVTVTFRKQKSKNVTQSHA